MSDLIGTSKRDFLAFTGKAGLSTVVASAIGVNLGLVNIATATSRKVTPFSFAIISDSHLFSINDHKFDHHLEDAVAQVNGLENKPDFVLYGGDIAQNGTEDQLAKGQKILSKLTMPMKVIPGEHDWYLDMGAIWRDMFGKETWSFDHKGVHFIGLNSILVKDFWTGAGMSPKERTGVMEMLESPIAGPWGIQAEQLAWLKNDVQNLAPKRSHYRGLGRRPRRTAQRRRADYINKCRTPFKKEILDETIRSAYFHIASGRRYGTGGDGVKCERRKTETG